MDKNPLTSFLRCYGGDGLEREGGGEQLRLVGPSGHLTAEEPGRLPSMGLQGVGHD